MAFKVPLSGCVAVALAAIFTMAPAASACHGPPSVSAPGDGTSWQGPPFGVVPHATRCAAAASRDTLSHCSYAVGLTFEVLQGCPQNKRFCSTT